MSSLTDNLKDDASEEEKSGSDGKIIFSIIAILILIVCGILIASYFEEFSKNFDDEKKQEPSKATIYTQEQAVTSMDDDMDRVAEIERLKEMVKNQNMTIEELQEQLAKYKNSDSVSLRLSYVIKPKENYIAECDAYSLGEWALPEKCAADTLAKVKDEIASDRTIVVWEVIPVVDENRYGGLSPELKQEGLAAFRAKSIVDTIQSEIPDITILKGFTITQSDKRGYKIKAYYLE